jgi:hypothetical protein
MGMEATFRNTLAFFRSKAPKRLEVVMMWAPSAVYHSLHILHTTSSEGCYSCSKGIYQNPQGQATLSTHSKLAWSIYIWKWDASPILVLFYKVGMGHNLATRTRWIHQFSAASHEVADLGP